MHAHVCGGMLLMAITIAHCFDDYPVDKTYLEGTWAVHGNEDKIHLDPAQNTFTISYRATWQADSNATVQELHILFTESYFVFEKFRCTQKATARSTSDVEESEEFLTPSELQNRRCTTDKIDGLQYTSCTVFGETIHSQCRTIQIGNGFIDVECRSSELVSDNFRDVHHVFLLVFITKRNIETDILQLWKTYALHEMHNVSIPLERDGQQMKTPAKIIASIGSIALTNATEDSDDSPLPGISLRSMCFKNGMPTIMSRNPITYKIAKGKANQTERYLHVTVHFQLPRVEPGVYHCKWSVVKGRRNTMIQFRTNSMTCCSNHDLDKYLGYLATFRQHVDIHTRLHEYLNLMLDDLHFKQSKATIAKETHISTDNTCGYIIVVCIIVVFFAASCYIYRTVRRHIDACRREKMKLLEVLTKIDSRPTSYIFYDIFISYSSQDSAFIDTVILPGLETRGYTCCYDKRDFRLGTPVIQNICEGIYDSHKTLAILSKAYVDSNWCLEMEFALTFRRIVSDDGPTDGLVMLQYKPCKVDPVLKNENYLDWSDYGPQRLDEFWAKFTAVLGPPQVTEKKKQ